MRLYAGRPDGSNCHVDPSLRPSRIAVACAAQPRDPATYSGIPAALLAGIEANGDIAMGLNAQLPRRRRKALELALAAAYLRPSDVVAQPGLREALQGRQTALLGSRSLARAKSAVAASAIRRAPSFDGCIQFGTEFRLPRGIPYVTYDDSTVVQAARSYAYPWLRSLGRRGLRAIVRRQREVFLSATACCATSSWAAQSIVEDYGVPADRVHVVGIGAINVPDRSDEVRDWETPRFLFVGKAWDRKNGRSVLSAFAEVRATVPSAQLDLVGGHPDNLEQPGVVCHGLLRPGHAADQAILAALYARATCFVLPSLHEPSAISHVEAAAAGIGSIGSKSGGSATLIGDGGVTVDPHDLTGLTAAMLDFADPVRARTFGTRAHAHSQDLRWPLIAQRLRRALMGGDAPPYL
jgi:glycosyltransferase involved in cell wall biosynthesis